MQLVIIIFFPFETASHYVMETIRELAILLPQPLVCQCYGHMPPSLAL